MRTSGNLSIYVDNKAEDVPRLLVCRIKVGASAGLVFVMRPDQKKTVVVASNAERNLGWYSNGKTDCPTMPTEPISAEKAIQDVAAASQVATELSPIRLKSQWSGKCEFNADGFVVTLLRKPNSYTMLELESDPKRGGWIVRVHRLTNWHTSSKTHEEFQPFLKDAVAAVEQAALPMIGEACAVKELYRRGSLDVAYEQARPTRPAAVPKSNPVTGWTEAQTRAAAKEKPASKKAPKSETAPAKAPKAETAPAKAPKAEAAPAKVTAQPAASPALPASVPSTAPPVRRRPMTPQVITEPTVKVKSGAEDIDPAKDQALMGMFGDVMKDVMQQVLGNRS